MCRQCPTLDDAGSGECKERLLQTLHDRFVGASGVDLVDVAAARTAAGPEATGRRVLVVGRTAMSGIIRMRLESSGASVAAPDLHQPEDAPVEAAAIRALLDDVAGRTTVDAAIDAGKLHANAPVDAEALIKAGVLRRAKDGVRLLGGGGDGKDGDKGQEAHGGHFCFLPGGDEGASSTGKAGLTEASYRKSLN